MSLCSHGYTAFWDCPDCDEPMGTKPLGAPRNAPLEYSHCSRCRDNAEFVWDAYEKDWMSECCHAPAVGLDQHIGENYKPGHSSDLAF